MTNRETPDQKAAQLRQSFPDACKWFQRWDAQAQAEVEDRAKRFQEQGASPCLACPLCSGDH